MLELIGTLAGALALFPAGARWLRVSQREHYLAGSTTRFAWRWWGRRLLAPVMAVVALAGTGVAFAYPIVAVAPAAIVVLGPPSLGVRGRSAPLTFTRRLRFLAALWLVLQALVIGVGLLVHHAAAFAALGACAVPVLVDVAAGLLGPVERRLVTPYVTAAQTRLAQVAPTVVAITGSFGKTSTKQHVAYLLAGSRAVVASPASFNNRAGLARAVNEQLLPGTEVFVAEMGTYGKGEIAELCRWCPPSIAVITAIGPVHLERFKTEDAIVAAKSEITEAAHTVVLNVDNPHLAALADRLAAAGTKSVMRCSAVDPAADVCVEVVRGVATVRVGAGDEPGLRAGRRLRARGAPGGGDRPYPRTPDGAQSSRLRRGAIRCVGDRRHVQLQPEWGPGGVGGTRGPRRGGSARRGHAGHGRAGTTPVRGESRVRRGDRP
jgi:UDP-N-acetylmuramoyl-tripeptide--D-alanyl-D-alanine ligase